MAELKLIKMSEIEPKSVGWLWQAYIPLGAVTLIQGDGGLGKTSISLAIAAAVSRGEVLPTNGITTTYEQTSPETLIVQNAEDSYFETIRPRLDQLGADNNRIVVIDDEYEPLTFMDNRIEEAIIRTGAKLIILDPLQAYFGRANMNSAGSVRPIMKHLGKIAERNQCAILLVGHLGKNGNKASYRGLGSVDIFAAARSVLTVGVVEDLETGEKTSVMAHNKSNLAPHGSSLAFEIDPINGFRWLGECDINVKEVFAGEKAASKAENPCNSNKPESQLDKAKHLIRNTLDNSITEASYFEQLAENHGLSLKTIHRAKTALGIRSVKRGDIWYWELPIEGEYTEINEIYQGSQDFNMSENHQQSQDRHLTELSILSNSTISSRSAVGVI